MDVVGETAALVALLRVGNRSPKWYSEALLRSGSARALLDEELGLLTEMALAEAVAEVEAWEQRQIKVVSAFDPRFPMKLRGLAGIPPLLFVAGTPIDADERTVAVVGTRQPTVRGTQMARKLSRRLTAEGYTVVSGLAAGIDTVAHEAALERQGRTIAVIGSGLDHFYPRQNAGLQRRISQQGAVVSQFWPESGPTRGSFPLRNVLMAALSDACVIVEASAMSGTRILARAAVDMRRTVILVEDLLEQQWARELAEHPGVEVARSVAEITQVLGRAVFPPAHI